MSLNFKIGLHIEITYRFFTVVPEVVLFFIIGHHLIFTHVMCNFINLSTKSKKIQLSLQKVLLVKNKGL